jgi:tRNA nucleotidyltransferase (CCA-adding enzyme)
MALDVRWGTFHDPYDGLQDLEDNILRAVNTDAFKQDPLRILRGARFAARLDADIDDTTKRVMRESVTKLSSLPQERVRMEMEKALVQADEPSRFFEVLDDIGALKTTFPELYDLMGVSAGPDEFHKEEDAFVHTMMVLDEMSKLRPNDALAGLMALAHDLGKAKTAGGQNHGGHCKKGMDIVSKMASRLSMSNEQERAMREASRLHMRFHNIDELRASTVVKTWEEMNHFHRMLDLAIADSRGRIPSGGSPQGKILARFGAAKAAVEEWDGERLIEEGYDPDEMGGKEFGDLLHQKRVELMREFEQ